MTDHHIILMEVINKDMKIEDTLTKTRIKKTLCSKSKTTKGQMFGRPTNRDEYLE